MMLRVLLLAVIGMAALTACAVETEDGQEDFLRGLCIAAGDYAADIEGTTDTQQIAAATEAYRSAVAALQPPDDVRDYHTQLVEYLGRLASDPAASPGNAPEIPDDADVELTALAQTIEECREATYFTDGS